MDFDEIDFAFEDDDPGEDDKKEGGSVDRMQLRQTGTGGVKTLPMTSLKIPKFGSDLLLLQKSESAPMPREEGEFMMSMLAKHGFLTPRNSYKSTKMPTANDFKDLVFL